MNHIKTIAQELGLNEKAVEAAVNLIDEGNTIPFIARYRKEATGSMDDQVLRKLGERLDYLRGLEKRRDEVKRSIEEQGALTEELAQKLEAAETLARLAGVKVVFENPDDAEKAGYSRVNRAVLDPSKIEKLGFESRTSLEQGLTEMLNICRNNAMGW